MRHLTLILLLMAVTGCAAQPEPQPPLNCVTEYYADWHDQNTPGHKNWYTQNTTDERRERCREINYKGYPSADYQSGLNHE